jgi:hypothetical protein
VLFSEMFHISSWLGRGRTHGRFSQGVTPGAPGAASRHASIEDRTDCYISGVRHLSQHRAQSRVTARRWA